MSDKAVDVAAQDRLAVPGPSPEVEAERRRVLRRYKAVATGLLLVAAAIYFACRRAEAPPLFAPRLRLG